MPMRARPSRGSLRLRASAATRATMAPTARQVMRISSATAEPDDSLASQATWSSKSLVNLEAWRAHGRATTTTP